MDFKIAGLIAALVLLLGLVGHWDMEAEEEDAAQYCEMVKAHLWPDYKEICKNAD